MEENKLLNALSTAVSRGSLAAIALDFLDEHLKALSEAADRRIFIMMNKAETVELNTLLQAYAEKNAYNNLRTTLLQGQKIGQSSGVKFKKLTEKSDGIKNNKPRRAFSAYRS